MSNGILFSHSNEWNNAILSNMDELKFIMLSEVSQTKKDKYHMISFIGGILKKWYKWAYTQNRDRLTDLENKLMVTQVGRDELEGWA